MFNTKVIKDITTRIISSNLYVIQIPRMYENIVPTDAPVAITRSRMPLILISAIADMYMGFAVLAIPKPIPRITRARYSIGREAVV